MQNVHNNEPGKLVLDDQVDDVIELMGDHETELTTEELQELKK